MNNQLGIVYTVKNEASMLPSAIRYYRRLGCSSIFVFLDNSTDDTEKLISSIPGVYCYKSMRPDAELLGLDWIKQIAEMWDDNMDVRKRINAMYALRFARQLGVQWLAAIDPDELIYDELFMKSVSNSWNEFFGRVSQHVDQVCIPNIEVVPTMKGVTSPFVDFVYFNRRFSVLDPLWRYSSGIVRRIFRSPKFVAWYDFVFYRLFFLNRYPRLMRNPLDGGLIPTSYFLGYTNCKSVIRVSRAIDFNFDTHRWRGGKRSPVTTFLGNVLHYDFCNSTYFAEKFRKRNEALIVKAFHCRYVFGIIARSGSNDQVDKFYNENVIIAPDMADRLVACGILQKITFVREFLSASE